MSAISTLLIDLDGTLVDFNDVRVRLNFVLRFLSWWSPHLGPLKALKGLSGLNEGVKAKSKSPLTNSERGLVRFSEVTGISLADARLLTDQCLEEIFPKLEKYFRPVPGAREFVDWAAERYALVLATNPVWPSSIVEMRIQWAGIHPRYFRSYTHAEKMRFTKPQIDYYLEILEQEKLAPEDCLVVGNDVVKDGAAREAGIKVFILSNRESFVQMDKLLWSGSYLHLKTFLKNGCSQ